MHTSLQSSLCVCFSDVIYISLSVHIVNYTKTSTNSNTIECYCESRQKQGQYLWCPRQKKGSGKHTENCSSYTQYMLMFPSFQSTWAEKTATWNGSYLPKFTCEIFTTGNSNSHGTPCGLLNHWTRWQRSSRQLGSQLQVLLVQQYSLPG